MVTRAVWPHEERLEAIREKQRAAELAEMKRTSRGLMLSFLAVMLLMLGWMAIFPDKSYSLNSAPEDDPKARTVVATFNSAQGAEANKANCETMFAAMKQQKPAYKVRYTCDRGRR